MDANTPLYSFLLQLGDNALILGHRLGEWCGHAPEMELDIALTNIALDLTGQARALYQRATELNAQGKTEDDLAYLRDVPEFRNVLLVEQPNGDFAHSIARQFYFDAFNYFFHEELTRSSDAWLSGFAVKSLKEITYHLRFSSEWVLRLGDGTATSHEKMQTALDDLWYWTGEMTTPSDLERQMAADAIGPSLQQIKSRVNDRVNDVVSMATLQLPTGTWMQSGGKVGRHTEHLGFILAEMQFLQRAYPGNEW
ncbi:MAG: phenylacetate-CoA oxygenase subunit PaaI [Saprospiraceae bacterium]|nr:MAG: phenylacetate-CoA oxygenase subunit PaaI [Saprospiraceae bacterium]